MSNVFNPGSYVSSADWLYRVSLGKDDCKEAPVGEVICAEAVAGMAGLPTYSVGAVVSDPPIFATHNWLEEPDQEIGLIEEASHWATTFMLEFSRVIRPGGAIAIMAGTSQAVAAWMLAAETAGLPWMAEITVLWDEASKRRRSNVYGSLCTRILWFTRPGARFTVNADKRSVFSNIIICDRIPVKDREHPGQKPVELTTFLISLLTKEGDTVLDPFCGSGSTLVSAAIVKRKWIGMDADPRACEIARRRVRDWRAEDEGEIRMWIREGEEEEI